MVIKLKNVFRSLAKCLLNLHLVAFIASFMEDICIFSGLGFITGATFLWSKIAGYYVLGLCLLGVGVYLARNPIKRG
jgi:hypothetical protein